MGGSPSPVPDPVQRGTSPVPGTAWGSGGSRPVLDPVKGGSPLVLSSGIPRRDQEHDWGTHLDRNRTGVPPSLNRTGVPLPCEQTRVKTSPTLSDAGDNNQVFSIIVSS